MKRIVKASLLLMVILTVIYAGLVVYANANSVGSSSYRYIVHVAFEYESETPPTEWYTPEQLGIVEILDYEENCTCFEFLVDREKKPFPLGLQIFKYKDKFYQISDLWITFGLPESAKGPAIGGGLLVGAGWVVTGALFLKGRKAE